jgi:hypothetical protein
MKTNTHVMLIGQRRQPEPTPEETRWYEERATAIRAAYDARRRTREAARSRTVSACR